MDGKIVFDPSQVVVDPVALGVADDEPLEEMDSQEYDSQDDEVDWKARYEEATRKITDQGQQIGQLTQTVNSMLAQSQQAARQVSYQEPQTSQGYDDGEFNWGKFLNEGGNGMMNYNEQSASMGGQQSQQRYLTPEEAQAIARQEIANTIQGIQQQQNEGQQLFQRFMSQDADLIPYSELVRTMYGTADQRIPATQRYEHVIGQVRNMIQTGQLPTPQAPRQQGRMLSPHGSMPVNLNGGQMGNPYAQPAQEQQVVRYDDKFLASELQAWQDERKNALARKMGAM